LIGGLIGLRGWFWGWCGWFVLDAWLRRADSACVSIRTGRVGGGGWVVSGGGGRVRVWHWALAGVAACALFAWLVAVDLGSELKLTDGNRGLRVTELGVGHGVAAAAGDEVVVLYRGELPDGSVVPGLDLYEQGRPHRFVIGDGSVIGGLDRGVRGMRSGGVRRVTVPPLLHYGEEGYAGLIPARTSLVLTVEMVSVRQRAASAFVD